MVGGFEVLGFEGYLGASRPSRGGVEWKTIVRVH